MGCYICGEQATSVEHAPARCFFPEDRRVNLTTVESCATHNEDTSKDDEYVRNIIAMSIGNNQVALTHFLQNCMRSFNRSPRLFQATTGINKRVYIAETEHSNIQPTYAFSIDRDRINLVMRKIAYATFFKKYEMPWNRELAIGTEYLRTSDMKADDFGLLIQEAKRLIGAPTYEGNNPEVFKFSFLQTESDDVNEQLLIMSFYEGFEAWVFPQPATVGPKI